MTQRRLRVSVVKPIERWERAERLRAFIKAVEDRLKIAPDRRSRNGKSLDRLGSLRRRSPDVARLQLRSRVSELFSQTRSAAGSRSILSLMREDGEQIGRFKVRSLMRELDLVSKQPGSHAYKRATVERLDIPNTLNREFDVPTSNQVWCGDITYIWAQGKWHYLAVVLDLCTRRIVGWAMLEKPDAELVIKALERLTSSVASLRICYSTRTRDRNMQADSFASVCGDTACARA